MRIIRTTRIIKYISFLAVLFVMSCTSRFMYKFIYNNLDHIVYYSIDSYLDLNKEQSEILETKLRYYLDKNKSEELPKYIALLKNLKAKFDDTISIDEIDWGFNSMNLILIDLSKSIRNDALLFIKTITDDQIEFLKKKMDKENEKREKKANITEQKRIEKRIKKAIDFTEDMVGKLSTGQKDKIALIISNSSDDSMAWREIQKKKQKLIINLLRSKSSDEEILKSFDNIVFNTAPEIKDDYEKMMAQSRIQFKKIILEINNIISAEQRKYFLVKIDEYIYILESLR